MYITVNDNVLTPIEFYKSWGNANVSCFTIKGSKYLSILLSWYYLLDSLF